MPFGCYMMLHGATEEGRGSFVCGGDDASFREKGVQRRYGTPRVTGRGGLTEVGISRPKVDS
jgi:hypothetical protein